MKNKFLKSVFLSALVSSALFTSCNSDDNLGDVSGGEKSERWITVAGALMQDEPGDGNGGTKVFSVSKENAKNPDYVIDVYENGFSVPSNRTARLQSSQDGNTLFNIAYTGENGGHFSKYHVQGGNKFPAADVVVDISSYAGSSPRWAKLFDGDKTGIAVNVTSPAIKTGANDEYLY